MNCKRIWDQELIEKSVSSVSSSSSQVIEAPKAGNLDIIARALQGKNVRHRWFFLTKRPGKSPFEMAAQEGHLEIIQSILHFYELKKFADTHAGFEIEFLNEASCSVLVDWTSSVRQKNDWR